MNIPHPATAEIEEINKQLENNKRRLRHIHTQRELLWASGIGVMRDTFFLRRKLARIEEQIAEDIKAGCVPSA